MKIATPDSLKHINNTINKYLKHIAPTYGPAGKKTLISLSEFDTKAVDDTFQTTRELEQENEFEEAVMRYIRGDIQKVKDKVGDFTTTYGLLFSSLFLETLGDTSSQLHVLKDNYHAEVLEIDKGIKEAIEEVKKNAKQIKNKQELFKIAYNAYNNEPIAELISDTIFKIGKDGLLAISDSQTAQTEVEMVEGLELEKGYVSPYFINTDKEEVLLNNCSILVFNKRLDNFGDLVKVINSVEPGNSLFVVAEGFGEQVTTTMAMLSRFGIKTPQGGLLKMDTLLVEAPGYGENKLEYMNNLAVVTGAEVVDNLTQGEVVTGFARRVVAKKDKTTVMGGKGDKQEIDNRIAQLESRLERVKAPYEKDIIEKSIASLKGGMALIKVGAYTENDQKSMKSKIENAVNSTKLAYKHGIVKGAGQSLSSIKTSSVIVNRALKVTKKQLEENGKEFLDNNTLESAGGLMSVLEIAGSTACALLEFGSIITVKREEDKDKLKF